MTNEVVKTEKAELKAQSGGMAIVPTTVEQVFRMAQMIAQSGLAPKDMQSPEKIVVAICHGMEIGLKPMQALQSIAVIGNRPCLWGDAVLALVQGSGLLVDIVETFDEQTMTATCVVQRENNAKTTRHFSQKDATTAGLWGGNVWRKYPKRMLQMRARGFALRDKFADILKGVGIAEEVRDYEATEKITAANDQKITVADIEKQAAPEAVKPEIIEAEIEEIEDETPTAEWLKNIRGQMMECCGDVAALQSLREQLTSEFAVQAVSNEGTVQLIQNEFFQLLGE